MVQWSGVAVVREYSVRALHDLADAGPFYLNCTRCKGTCPFIFFGPVILKVPAHLPFSRKWAHEVAMPPSLFGWSARITTGAKGLTSQKGTRGWRQVRDRGAISGRGPFFYGGRQGAPVPLAITAPLEAGISARSYQKKVHHGGRKRATAIAGT